ncbi:cation-transporting P-type ATPase [Bacillus sp. FJAT-45350]|uniref:cation-transporting P-type ATPase n=1 Tax=Bacillus sp. FJAT-45350 TaxID=2011014 RepID=UPI000BB82A0E|nr:cation-transporting P-type ATPase [Bacillus sp. FJAT-45350]
MDNEENQQNKSYNLDIDTVIKELATDLSNGLQEHEISKRLEDYGVNELPEAKKESSLVKFLKHFNDVLIYVLLAAAIITGVLGHYIDTAVIVMVAVVNAFIGFLQENKAEKALNGIKKMLSLKANVIRDGKRSEVDSNQIVPGDIVILSAGIKIPADIRVIKCENLKVEESALTGESTAVQKNPAKLPDNTVLGDRINMVFSGTSVASGTGVGIVTATGKDTELGKINKSISEVEVLKTPLIKQTDNFGKMVALVILVAAIFMYGFGYFLRDYPAGELLLSVIGLAVAAIPEGLPAIVSIILALGVQNMAGKKAIVRNLPSVETLGAVSVICSDKTGTLTKNEMTVTSVVTKNEQYDITGTGYSPEGKIVKASKQVNVDEEPFLKEMLTCVNTCNDASLRKNEDDQWVIIGEPTEGCLLTLVEKANTTIEKFDVQSKIPFDSEYKYMATLVENRGEKIIYIKGAPDRLFNMVSSDVDSAFDRGYWEGKVSEFASTGQRVIGAAYKKVSSDVTSIDHEDLKKGVVLLGLTGIIDPPREEAVIAINECAKAGIKVKMITGDHKDTAMAIGKQLGIGNGELALEGKDIDQMSVNELAEAVNTYDVFARTSPANKLQLVTALQENGHICAMTGDGVNDAPALKRADIGVAMGIKGTEVAKDASQMILVDDNFKTIVNAVQEGRRVYDNLKKTILFILPTNGAQAFLVMASILLGMTMPLTPVQILWVNMVIAVTLSLALAFEQLEKGTMNKPPRPLNTPLLSGYYIFRIGFVSLLIGGATLLMNIDLINRGYEQAVANTITLHTIVILQLLYLFNCRSESESPFNRDFFSNKAVFIVSAALLLLQFMIIYVPFMNTIFGTAPIEMKYWIVPFAMGIGIFIIVEVEKFLTKMITRK